MIQKNEILWRKIQAHVPGYSDTALSFAQRLGRDNGWSEEYALRVVTEYKRFVYLAVTLGHPVTPSDQVDQAWHLHLAYTRDYWDVFCPQVLGRSLHHDPTQGGDAERTKYKEWYAQTLAAYVESFGHPPQDIWPAPEIRFTQGFQRKEITHHLTGPPKLGWVAGFASALGFSGAAWGGVGSMRSALIWLFLGVGIIVLFVLWKRKKNAKSQKNDGNGGCGGGCGGGGCGGGCGG